jgi:hypothetical protein
MKTWEEKFQELMALALHDFPEERIKNRDVKWLSRNGCCWNDYEEAQRLLKELIREQK